MRTVRLTKEDADMSWASSATTTYLTGTDVDTAEVVTFGLEDIKVVNSILALLITQGVVSVPLEDHQVMHVQAPGEWDSPGTSEEL